ncbi:hypothetical protein CC78DRAFT_548189 [Lojkania enalia]|uniref:Uncharacterized protein n=1 Tax=Lojkania enalia TaxID=147567 RepID=A0A9P4JYM9_9PLEO|nr:hypothetical protein CC78DRAFT_548189 [Didymosphaeria enalia]
MRSRKRTRVPWLKSDELWLLAYKVMNMEWKDIFELSPGSNLRRRTDAGTCCVGVTPVRRKRYRYVGLGVARVKYSISSRDLLKTTFLSMRDDDDGKLRDKWECFLANTDSHKRHERGEKRKRLLEEEVLSSRASPKLPSRRVRTTESQFRIRSARLRLRTRGSCGT